MTPTALALIPSILPARPGSVEVSWSCKCGGSFLGPIHASVLEKVRRIFLDAHRHEGCDPVVEA